MMARRGFRVRSLDEVLVGAARADTVEIALDRTLDASAAGSLFADTGAATAAVRDAFLRVVDEERRAPLGTVVLHDVVVLGRGLLVEPATRTIWAGEAIGWADHSIAMDLRVLFGHEDSAREDVAIDDDALLPAAELDAAVLIAQPGIDVYGHWLIDVIPRIHAWAQHSSDLPVLTGVTRQWQVPLAARFGLDLRASPSVRPHQPVRVRRLVVPTLTKRRQVLDRPATAAAWDALRAALLALPVGRDLGTGERLYVSRAGWDRGRSLLNDDEIEARVAQHGYVVVRPEEISLRQQARVFGGARHVIGIDGSGLHNVAFADGSVTTTVIDMGRANLWHAGVANVRRQAVSHLAALEEPGRGWRLPPEVLDRHLELIGDGPVAGH